MKKTIGYMAFTFCVILLSSCQKTNGKRPLFLTHPELTENFTSGSWHIATFKINGKQQRQNYSNSHFSFTRQNLVSVKIDEETYVGDWWVESDSSDDEPSIDLSFSMDFQRKEQLKYLNGDWAILERTKNKLRLLLLDTDDLEYVTFEKDSLTD